MKKPEISSIEQYVIDAVQRIRKEKKYHKENLLTDSIFQ